MGANHSILMEAQKNLPLDHTSVAVLRAVTDRTQEMITDGKTYWSDVIQLLDVFTKVDFETRSKFPGSMIISEVIEKTTSILDPRGFTGDNTLFASSVCPDEINHDVDNLPARFAQHWGECFHMGGLAGIPFPGQSGFGAFAAHVPDDGNLFVLFAPHIGIAPDGEFGKYARRGQNSVQMCKACGAAIGAYNHLKNGRCALDYATLGENPYDYQQQWIISQIAPHFDEINSSPNPMVALSHRMYAIIQDYMSHILHTRKAAQVERIVILGGIHINTPFPMEDYFLPICFELHTLSPTKEIIVENLFDTAFKSESKTFSKQARSANRLLRSLSRVDTTTSFSSEISEDSLPLEPSVSSEVEDSPF